MILSYDNCYIMRKMGRMSVIAHNYQVKHPVIVGINYVQETLHFAVS